MNVWNSISDQQEKVKQLLGMEQESKDLIHICQITDQLVDQSLGSILIPQGFRSIENQPVTWNISVDRHLLKTSIFEIIVPGTAFVNDGTQLIDTMVKLYQVRLLGLMYYNIVCGDFIAVNPKYSGDKTIFSTFGCIPVNFIVGYVLNPDEIQVDIIDQLIFDVVFGDPIVVKNGVSTEYNPLQKYAFYALFDGSSDMSLNLPFQNFISTTPNIS